MGLEMLTDSGDLPDGYGVTPAKLGREFDEQEDINTGLQQKGFPIVLPHQIWKPQM